MRPARGGIWLGVKGGTVSGQPDPIGVGLARDSLGRILGWMAKRVGAVSGHALGAKRGTHGSVAARRARYGGDAVGARTVLAVQGWRAEDERGEGTQAGEACGHEELRGRGREVGAPIVHRMITTGKREAGRVVVVVTSLPFDRLRAGFRWMQTGFSTGSGRTEAAPTWVY